jgi:hypothetical protein
MPVGKREVGENAWKPEINAQRMTAGFMRNETRRWTPDGTTSTSCRKCLIRFEKPVSSLTPIELSDKHGASEFRAAPTEGVLRSTARYLLRTEVHTFAFSVAANAILSFFPFLLLLMTLIRYVFHSRVMYASRREPAARLYSDGTGIRDRNLNALVGAHHRAQVFSLAMLLITSTGIFLPLEVALNRVWGFRNNRSYFRNQLMSLGLVFACGSLALLSVGLTAGNVAILTSALHGYGAWYMGTGGLCDHEGLFHSGEHRHLFSCLLAIAEREGAGSGSSAGGGDHGTAFGGAEVRLHLRVAAAEFCGSVRAVRDLGEPDVLGVFVGNAAADGSAFVGAKDAFGLRITN